MLPAPVIAFIRYIVVYASVKLADRGWTFFGFDAETTDAIVQIVALLITVAMASIGAWLSKVSSVIARLKDRHKTELVAAASDLPDVHVIHADPAIANAIPGPKVVAP